MPPRALLAALLLLPACATSDKITPRQVGDARLSCDDLETEFAGLDEAEKAIDENKGLNGTNVASAIFWLPGLAYTFYDAGQADELIRERRSYLSELSDEKGCG